MASNSAAHDAHEEHKIRLSDNIRGALIVAVGAGALIGLSWGMMTLLTSPEGWITQAASTAVSGEDVQLVSFADSGE